MKQILVAFGFLLLACGGLNAEPLGGYLFVTFRGEATPMSEQIYFLLSKDGQQWRALNQGEPILVSALGEQGVRDPFILRAYDNKKFYLLATDLSINLHPDWQRAQTRGSQSLVIWESTDLINWSAPRLVKVAANTAGCTWAPEAVYDQEAKNYLVFWASKTAADGYDKQRIWAARTRDFKKFSKPFIYMDKQFSVIDTTIVRAGHYYYRFSKDEQNKAITMEKSAHLIGGWHELEDFTLGKLLGYEGPTIFAVGQASDSKAQWRLLLDYYSKGQGYQAFTSNDLASALFTKSAVSMEFPFHPVRHGTVIQLSKSEYRRLQSH